MRELISKTFWSIFARAAQTSVNLKTKVLNRASITDISTDKFNSLIRELISDGWKKTYEYDGLDAWIDYGKITLKKDRSKLTCEWDNWFEGSIEGPRAFMEVLATAKNLKLH